MVPFNPLRLYVMGLNDSRERVNANERETKQMQAIIHEAMEAGAFGWSSMKTLLNRPDDGRFIPSQVASNEEYLALSQAMAPFGIGSIGWTRGQAERLPGSRTCWEALASKQTQLQDSNSTRLKVTSAEKAGIIS